MQINDQSGLSEPWPLLGGLPFAEGELADVNQIRVLDDNGVEVPAQVDVAARWRDGSIRWAHLGMTANPQGNYRVEFGPGIQRSQPPTPLEVKESSDGKLTIDTGAISIEFLPDQLLPSAGRMGEIEFLQQSGGGAYLVDNSGRLARVAGTEADIQTQILKQGPMRTVVRREGWYVTADGERLAKAKAWFYFAAGSPAVRITHTLIFTEDTNELWVRDYGLEFRTPTAPERAIFPVGGADGEDLLALRPVEVEELIEVPLHGGEAYLLQAEFPSFAEREARAVVGLLSDRSKRNELATFWAEPWVAEWTAAGDWGDGAWKTHGLTVVMPWLAQRFPQEISFGPDGARAVFWSGRSGRELDFRAVTLVNEVWRSWADSTDMGVENLAASSSNAEGAARTHDVWLIPHGHPADTSGIQARADAASHPPLLLADPARIAATGAVGWLSHPVDREQFPREEEVISDFWDALMADYERNRRTGFFAFGNRPLLRGNFFRSGGTGDYGLRRHVWNLYSRSGDRKYFDFATRFSRFFGDLGMAHINVSKKHAGSFFRDEVTKFNRPVFWENSTDLFGGTTGHDIVHLTLDYYLTGDEYPMEMARMNAEAFKAQWEDYWPLRSRYDSIFMSVRVLGDLYAIDHDPELLRLGRQLLEYVTDLDQPNAISDDFRLGSLYKEDRNMSALYYFYQQTGDELARQAFLQNLEDQYRFNRIHKAFDGQALPGLLYSVAYEWTGKPEYLSVLASLLEEHRRWNGEVNINTQMHPTMGIPAALGIMAGVDETVLPYPLVRLYGDTQPAQILFRKSEGLPVTMRIHLQMASDGPEDAETTALLRPHGENGTNTAPELLPINVTVMQETDKSSRTNKRRRYVELTVPADKPAGLYALEFPNTDLVDILNSDAVEISAFSPAGFRMEGAVEFFRVDEGTETLEFFLGVPTRVIRPDGSVALEASAAGIGLREVAVNGQYGAWRLEPNLTGTIRLLNAEPLFARSPGLLVTGASVAPAPRFKAPGTEMAFVEGRNGPALHLPGRKELSFPRGKSSETGYEFFPGNEGTVEFWFRPNWASLDLPYNMGTKFNDSYFLRSGSHDLQYRRGQVHSRRPEFASLNLWAYGRDTNAGFTGRHWFEAGEWVHVAFTWKTTEGQTGNSGFYAVFINGEPVERDFFKGGPLHYPGGMTGEEPFFRQEADESITIGPFDGTISELRISDVVRYQEPFTPPADLPAPDSHTRVQFPLKGSFEGVNSSGPAPALQP